MIYNSNINKFVCDFQRSSKISLVVIRRNDGRICGWRVSISNSLPSSSCLLRSFHKEFLKKTIQLKNGEDQIGKPTKFV